MTLKQRRQYFFRKSPYGAWTLLAFGIFFLTIALIGTIEDVDQVGGAWALGLLMTAFGVTLVVLYKKGHTDLQIDLYCDNLRSDEQPALPGVNVRSSSDAVIKRVRYCGYCFENFFSSRVSRRGKDGRMRSSIYEMGELTLTPQQLVLRRNLKSLISDEHIESNRDYSLTSITGIAIQQRENACLLCISADGDRIPIPLEDRNEAQVMEAAIQSAKNALLFQMP